MLHNTRQRKTLRRLRAWLMALQNGMSLVKPRMVSRHFVWITVAVCPSPQSSASTGPWFLLATPMLHNRIQLVQKDWLCVVPKTPLGLHFSVKPPDPFALNLPIDSLSHSKGAFGIAPNHRGEIEWKLYQAGTTGLSSSQKPFCA
jgi:hypothetical protein